LALFHTIAGQPAIFHWSKGANSPLYLRLEPFSCGRRPIAIERFIQTKEKAMSRKLILSLAAIATVASAAFVSGSADAMVRGGRGGHVSIIRVGHTHFRDHGHWRFHERGYIRSVGYVQPIASAGPCTCLTKDYTPEGTVVFKDLCTQEMASAPVDGGPAKASEAEAPTNFAGKTYQDYLAANQQKN
jgi:hypothetical protein